MANVLVATAPAEGHVNVIMHLVKELVRRGNTVTWYTGKVFRDRVERTGAAFSPIVSGFDYGGMTHDEAFPHHAGLTGVRGMVAVFRDVFLGTAPDQLRDLSALADELKPDVIVTDETTYAGGFLSELKGIPLVWTATSIYTLGSRDTAPFGMGLKPSSSFLGRLRNRTLKWTADHVLMRELRRVADRTRAEVGLAPIAAGAFENIVRMPSLYLLGTVPSFEYPRSDLLPQTRFVGPITGTASDEFEAPHWWDDLRAHDTVVHLTQGTVANEPERLLRPAIRALSALDALVVVTTGVPPEQLDLGPLPDNVRVERFVPYHHLLPHADLLVTNGGYGGVTAALSNGVPLVVASATEDKNEVGAHVGWSGAGVHLKSGDDLERRLGEAVRRVLSEPSFRARAERFGAEYRALNGPRRAAELIEELAGGAGPRAGGPERERSPRHA
ncbi:glycosyltransferase [Streptomyces cadmiisoli]|uniref:Glycosyltransferase n=2 Tax=Streptomyces TaxID=1883 RepID=A0A2Z4IXP2_9ACTN|nr:glycosyltransferase [Streptomyces cadmiisoli]AWW37585.1 glycosyltransferase [Streptomyces cadmiisoli]